MNRIRFVAIGLILIAMFNLYAAAMGTVEAHYPVAIRNSHMLARVSKLLQNLRPDWSRLKSHPTWQSVDAVIGSVQPPHNAPTEHAITQFCVVNGITVDSPGTSALIVGIGNAIVMIVLAVDLLAFRIKS